MNLVVAKLRLSFRFIAESNWTRSIIVVAVDLDYDVLKDGYNLYHFVGICPNLWDTIHYIEICPIMLESFSWIQIIEDKKINLFEPSGTFQNLSKPLETLRNISDLELFWKKWKMIIFNHCVRRLLFYGIIFHWERSISCVANLIVKERVRSSSCRSSFLASKTR